MMELAEVIKVIRKELKITQEELAEGVHVSYSTVNRWENKRTVPTRMAKVVLLDFFKKRKVSAHLIEDLCNCI